MKTTYTFIKFTVLFGLLFSIGFFSCKKNPKEGTKIVINYDIIKTKINFEFYDAASGELIGQQDNSRNVTVKIYGEDRDAVLDISGADLNDFSAISANGFMTLALNPNNGFIPKSNKPIQFTVVAEIDGYISSSLPISIYKEGNYMYVFNLVSIKDPPTGVTIKNEIDAGYLTNGKVTDKIEIETDNGEATLILDKDLLIKDEEGKPLEGSINVMLAHFDNTKDESLISFSGGFNVLVNQNNKQIKGDFYSAGFVAITITDSHGNKAAPLDNNLAYLKMKINPETYNPQTREKIKEGDSIPLYGYDIKTGKWIFEETVSVLNSRNSAGLYVFGGIKLWYWDNYDWMIPIGCDTGVSINIIYDDSISSPGFLCGILRRQADGSFVRWFYKSLDGKNDKITFINSSANVPVYIEWRNNNYYYDGDNIITINPFMLSISNLCGNNEYDIHISETKKTSTVIIDFTAHCASNPDVIIRPSYGARLRSINDKGWRYISMVNGHSEVSGVEVGKTYVIGVYVKNKWYDKIITVTQEFYEVFDLDLNAEVCSEVFDM